MKYETPQMTALTTAIHAIQETPGTNKDDSTVVEDAITHVYNDLEGGGYMDWED